MPATVGVTVKLETFVVAGVGLNPAVARVEYNGAVPVGGTNLPSQV